jgi:hypothetical protein
MLDDTNAHASVYCAVPMLDDTNAHASVYCAVPMMDDTNAHARPASVSFLFSRSATMGGFFIYAILITVLT